MTSTSALPIEDPVQNTLPTLICSNPRKKIGPEEIDSEDIKQRNKEKPRLDGQLVSYPPVLVQPPVSKYPLTLLWNPSQLVYELDEEPVVNVLSIWNGCPRSIYIHCCGLWDETARRGASWHCHPRTRFHLAPGMVSRLAITATPRDHSPVPLACAALQLAAAHMRDPVVGYFVVPIAVKFLNYNPPCLEEGE